MTTATATRGMQAVSTDDASKTTDPTESGDAISVGADRLDLTIHDCTLTLVNPEKGTHRTFQIKTIRRGSMKGKRIVSLLIGNDNEADYKGFATISDGTDRHAFGEIWVWQDFRGADKPSMYELYADVLNRKDYWAGRGVKFLAALRCRRCHRTLSHPESLATGYGPECIKKI